MPQIVFKWYNHFNFQAPTNFFPLAGCHRNGHEVINFDYLIYQLDLYCKKTFAVPGESEK